MFEDQTESESTALTHEAGVETFRPVVIAPSYNNDGTLRNILDRIAVLKLPMIVVNDGATDRTAGILQEFAEQCGEVDFVSLTHEKNRGKAAALRTGFAHARDRGFTHAVTIDTDDQLAPEDIPLLLEIATNKPDALIIGERADQMDNMPTSSSVGRLTSGLGLYLETGYVIQDSQCGLRVYPLHLFETVGCHASRFGFEAEVIARAAWADCDLAFVPVRCNYFPPQKRVSHFRLWRDSLYSFFMHAILTLRRLAPWPHPKVKRIRPRENMPRPPLWETIRWWLSPREFLRQFQNSRLEQLILAGGFGIGTFMANMPAGGFEPLLGVYASIRLRVHMLPILIGAQLALPPVGDALSYCAIHIGHFATHFGIADLTYAQMRNERFIELINQYPLSWCIGGVVTGFVCNWVMIGSLMLWFKRIPTKRELAGKT